MSPQFRNFLLFLASIFILIIVLPLILLVIVFPLILYRKVIIFLAWCTKANYFHLHVGRGVFAWDDMYGNPSCSLIVVNYLKGRHDTSKVIRRMETIVQIVSNFMMRKYVHVQYQRKVFPPS